MKHETKFRILALCVAGRAAAQNAPVRIFTDYNAYSAATAATKIIGFNGILPTGTRFENLNPLIVSGITFSSPSRGGSLDVATADYYAPHDYAGDFLMSVGSSNGAATVDIAFPSPTYAAGIDYGQLTGTGAGTITLSNGFIYSPTARTTTGSTAFFGFTSSTPVTGLSYTIVGDDALVMEDVRLGTPASLGALPTISMSLSDSIIAAGQSATLTWSSTNAASCMASSSWNGSQPTSGAQIVTPAVPGYYTYTLTCTGATYAGLQSVVLTVYGSTPVAETIHSDWYHTSYYTTLSVLPPNQIVGLQTAMTVPPLPPVPTAPGAVLYLWPGLGPKGDSVHLQPINIGLLQPVLTWGPDAKCPTWEPPAFSSWWISGLYVNTLGSQPGYTGCLSGDSMRVNPGDVLLINMTLDAANGVWAQSITDSATNQAVTFDVNLLGQDQNVAYFAIEVNFGSTIPTPVMFSNAVITYRSPDFSGSCSSAEGANNAYTLTPPVLNSTGTQCSIANVVLTQPTAAPVPVGVVNAASFAKSASGAGSAVAPGSLIQVYSSLAGAAESSAQSTPFPDSLGGVSVTFDGLPGAIYSVSPSGAFPFINVQIPFEITNSSTSMAVIVNGVPSAPVSVPVKPQVPGIFTSPPDGQHNAIFVYLDPTSGTATIAAPAQDAANFTIPTAPIPRGANGFFYATGLGSLAPSLADGAAPSLTDTTVYQALMMPTSAW